MILFEVDIINERKKIFFGCELAGYEVDTVRVEALTQDEAERRASDKGYRVRPLDNGAHRFVNT